MRNVTDVSGTVTLKDGTKIEFALIPDLGYQQWGAERSKLGENVHLLQALVEASDDFMVSAYDQT